MGPNAPAQMSRSRHPRFAPEILHWRRTLRMILDFRGEFEGPCHGSGSHPPLVLGVERAAKPFARRCASTAVSYNGVR